MIKASTRGNTVMTPTEAVDDPAPAPTELSADAQQQLGAQSRIRWMVSKRDFRARAHSNPLNDGFFTPPERPDLFDMASHFTDARTPHVTWCDVGCGYGGLLASLSVMFPHETMLGLEIRDRVTDYCRQRIRTLRKDFPGDYGNVSFERTNAMKFLVHYFDKASLSKIFFCYPDPHFKRKKNRQRIITKQLLAEYAYVLKPGGVAYIVTDVPELFTWMVTKFRKHPLFEQRDENIHGNDPVSKCVRDMTDEAQRVDKSDRVKQDASFVRIANPS